MQYLDSNKNLTFLGLGLLTVLMYNLLPASALPDYANYKSLYESATPGSTWEPFFVLIEWLCRKAGFTYETYRNIILVFCLITLSTVLYLSKAISFKNLIKQEDKDFQIIKFTTSILLTIFIGLTFILEFYFIRIRAGLAISFFFLAFFVVSSSNDALRRLSACLLFCAVYFIHKDSFFVLSIMLLLPWVLSELTISYQMKKNIAIGISALLTIVLFVKLEYAYIQRGSALYSNLHYVRFIMISIIPMIIFISPYNEYHFYRKNINSVPAISAWFSLVYAVMALGLSCYYFAGFATKSGEAIVRIFTLSSVPAVISVFHADSIYKVPLSAYLILINGLFFLATLGYLSLDIIH